MPPNVEREDWSALSRDALSRYAEPLLRAVANRLIKPRGNQPVEELLDKCVATFTNPPVIDRRLREMPEACRKLMAVIGLSRQPRWKVGHLLTLLAALGHSEGFAPIAACMECGLLFPRIPSGFPPLEAFEIWLGATGTLAAEAFVHPAVALRARAEPLGLPAVPPSEEVGSGYPRLADGLDWLLRLATVRQQVDGGSVRFTQANTLFKKDLVRLQTDEVLAAPPIDHSGNLPDAGVLALLWAVPAGLLYDDAGELKAAASQTVWDDTLPHVLSDLFAAFWRVEGWDPLLGYQPSESGLSPTSTAGFLSLLLLATAQPGDWVNPAVIADWLWTHHPSWAGTLPLEAASDRGAAWVSAFLRGVAYPLQTVELQGAEMRFSALGRHLLSGAPEPPAPPVFPQTLLVQPNAEILAYRQGLTPALIATLSRFARWKGLGPACTLELTPEQTYRGLESGLTLPMILQTLSRSATRPVPPAVADLLQRWASKRERITLFSSAVLVEFATPAELDAAVARGIVVIRLTDRIGITADGTEPALMQLRLIANRDYESKPQRCVAVADDGVTLTIDAAAADLLLDAEIGRFAVPLPVEPGSPRRFRLAADLLRRAGQLFSLADIDSWFVDRTGQALSPAGRLLLLGPQQPPATASRLLVVRFSTAELTDGAMQWSETRPLIAERLGPTAVVVAEDQLPALESVLREIGVNITTSEG
jgi:hypothetical protein